MDVSKLFCFLQFLICFFFISAAPKFISEKEMKKHSEKIYKTLPEVLQKKEERKKEQIKKTNLIMANLFNKVCITTYLSN